MQSIVNAIDKVIQAISDFSYWLYELMMYMLGYYSSFTASAILRLQVSFQDMYDTILSRAINFTADLYSLAHISELAAQYNALLATDAGYYLDYFLIDTAISSIITAYLIRFGIRRLPIIG